jgi:hypothetical protein
MSGNSNIAIASRANASHNLAQAIKNGNLPGNPGKPAQRNHGWIVVFCPAALPARAAPTLDGRARGAISESPPARRPSLVAVCRKG